MTHVLLSEYDKLLGEAAARWGADHGALVNAQHYVAWSAPMGGCRVSIDLDVDYRAADTHFVARLRLGGSATLPSDPLLALATLRDTENTLIKAIGAFAEVKHLRVYQRDAPCDTCVASGKAFHKPCPRCNGTGKRNEPPPADPAAPT